MVNNSYYQRFLSIDKSYFLHFFISYIITDIVLTVTTKYVSSKWLNILISFVVITLLSFIKEYIDYKDYNCFDFTDTLTNYFGFVIKVLIFLLSTIKA
uniref:Uncharacterized protein n=1 Tax=Geladintestivirus 2 TaxID=3233134 RepID=A0AAU8MI38_9CAUD